MNKEYHARLIDFGRVYFAKEITRDVVGNLAAYFAPNLGQITPECSTQDGIEEGIPFETVLQEILKQKPGLLYAERLFGQSRMEQISRFQKFWTSSKAIQQKDYVKFWSLYWPLVDAWSIGHNLASTLYRLSHSNNFMKGAEWEKKRGVIKAVITGLLKASPRERLDSIEALALYDPMNGVVLSESGKAWLKKKHEQRERMK